MNNNPSDRDYDLPEPHCHSCGETVTGEPEERWGCVGCDVCPACAEEPGNHHIECKWVLECDCDDGRVQEDMGRYTPTHVDMQWVDHEECGGTGWLMQDGWDEPRNKKGERRDG